MSKKELQKLQSDLEALINKNDFQGIFSLLLECVFIDLPTLNKLQNKFIHDDTDFMFLQRVGLFAINSVKQELKNAPDAVEENPALQDTRKNDLESELAYLQNEIGKAKGVLDSLQNEIGKTKNELTSLQSIEQNMSFPLYHDEIEAGKWFEFANECSNNIDKIDAYSKAIYFCQDYVLAYYERAKCYLEESKYIETLKDIGIVISLNYIYKDVCKLSALAKEALGKYKEAIIDYKHHLDLNKSDISVYYSIAICYSMIKDKENTIKYLSNAIETHDNNYYPVISNKAFNWLLNDDDFTNLLDLPF